MYSIIFISIQYLSSTNIWPRQFWLNKLSLMLLNCSLNLNAFAKDPPIRPSPTIPITLPNGKPAVVPDGTVMMFETDLRANNDYETEGTH